MKKNLYRVEIQPVKDKESLDVTDQSAICFDFESHDDLKQILARAGKIEGLSEQEIRSFAIGLKMLGEVMLEHRKHPLFAEFSGSFGQFMKTLKQSTK